MNGKIAAACIVGGIASLVIGINLLPETTAEQRAESDEMTIKKDVIDICWQAVGKRSLDPNSARQLAGACETAERQYYDRFGYWYKRNGR